MKIRELVKKKGSVTRYRGGFFSKDVYSEITGIDSGRGFIHVSPNILMSKEGRLGKLNLKVGDIIKQKIRPSKKYKHLLDIETEVFK